MNWIMSNKTHINKKAESFINSNLLIALLIAINSKEFKQALWQSLLPGDS